VVLLPRLARALHHPGIAVLLGVILVAVGVIGWAANDIPAGYAIVIITVGGINLLRGMPHEADSRSG
jgi:ABC-type Mn2+/Zn2+ transport system permease subunit